MRCPPSETPTTNRAAAARDASDLPRGNCKDFKQHQQNEDEQSALWRGHSTDAAKPTIASSTSGQLARARLTEIHV